MRVSGEPITSRLLRNRGRGLMSGSRLFPHFLEFKIPFETPMPHSLDRLKRVGFFFVYAGLEVIGSSMILLSKSGTLGTLNALFN